MPTADDFRAMMHRWLKEDEAKGKEYSEIHAGMIHRAVGGYPDRNGNHRIRTVCVVMFGEYREGDSIVRTPPSGFGANLVIRYRLPRKER